MPIYEYTCRACGQTFERLMRSHREPAPDCPSCGRPGPQKQFSSFAPTVAPDAAAARACGQCAVNPSCPNAGRGCGAVPG